MIVPVLSTYSVDDAGELGYYIGTALDELVSFALDAGCSASELRERFEESVERASDPE